MAAPITPFCKGNTNSQSRKMFTAVLTTFVTATSPGEPSLRQKDCRFRDRELATANKAKVVSMASMSLTQVTPQQCCVQ